MRLWETDSSNHYTPPSFPLLPLTKWSNGCYKVVILCSVVYSQPPPSSTSWEKIALAWLMCFKRYKVLFVSSRIVTHPSSSLSLHAQSCWLSFSHNDAACCRRSHFLQIPFFFYEKNITDIPNGNAHSIGASLYHHLTYVSTAAAELDIINT